MELWIKYKTNFNIFGKSGDLTIDYYVTNFIDQVVIDWETEGQISFYNLNGPSRANSFQLSLDYNPSEFLNLRFAYKNYDVKTSYNSGFLQRPLQAQIDFLQILVGNQGEMIIKHNGDGILHFTL